MDAQQLGAAVLVVLIVGAFTCIAGVLGALWFAFWIIRAVFRALTGRPVFQAEQESDLSDVNLSDYGDAATVHAPDLYIIPAKRPM
jgi:hypothetical protein